MLEAHYSETLRLVQDACCDTTLNHADRWREAHFILQRACEDTGVPKGRHPSTCNTGVCFRHLLLQIDIGGNVHSLGQMEELPTDAAGGMGSWV